MPDAPLRAAIERQLDRSTGYARRRADVLLRHGRIQRLSFAQTRLHAEVVEPGGVRHTVDVWVQPRQGVVEQVCDCWSHFDCVHAEVAVRAWLAGRPVEPGGFDHDPLSTGGEAALVSWAEGIAAPGLLDEDALALLKRHARIDLTRSRERRDTVRGVLAGGGARDWSPGLRHRLAVALRGAGMEVVEARAEAAQAERWRSRRPAEDALARLWDAVRAARAGRDETAPPSLREGTNSGRLTVETDPPGVSWVSAERAPCAGAGVVRMRLSFREPGGLAVGCACPRGPGPGCRPMTDLLDGTLDLLTRRGQERARERLAAALAVPAWERDLSALDAALGALGVGVGEPAEPEEDREGRLPGWRLFPLDGRGWAVQPAWTRPYKRKTGLRVWERQWWELERGQDALPPMDRAVLHAVEGIARSGVAPAGTVALASLVGHPRVVLKGGQVVAVDTAPLGLAWARRDDGGVQISVTLGGPDRPAPADFTRTLDHTEPDAALLAVEPDAARATVVEATPAARDFVTRLLSRGVAFPAAATAGLLARLPAIRSVVPVHLDASLRGRRGEPDRTPVVRLTPHADGALDVQAGTRPLPEGPVLSPSYEEEELSGVRDGERVFVERDPRSEADALALALADVLPEAAAAPWSARLSEPDVVLDRVASLQAAAATGAVQVEWTRAALRVAGQARTDHLKLRVGGGQDWLGLGGQLEGDGWTVEVAEALAALRAGRRYVPLEDGGFVQLTETLRSRLSALEARTLTDGRGQTRLAPLSADLLDELAGAGAEIDAPPELALQQARIDEAAAMDFSVPGGLRAELRPYQADGVRWLQRTAHWAPGAVLADDMGLGKTLQALALLLHRAADGPALVVAPTSVGFNWLSEAARFAQGLRCRAYRGRGRQKMLAGLGAGDVLVTSWDVLVRDAGPLAEVAFSTVVLDEAQAIKNPGTRRHRAARELDRGFTLALTGTPVENRSDELWSLFAVAVPGLLGARAWFHGAFARDVDGTGEGADAARTRLGGLIGPFLLRRTKAAVAPDLPARTEQVLRVELSAGERRLYDATRHAALIELEQGEDESARFRMLAVLTRLRQLACHPRLVDPKSRVRSSKEAALVELVDELVEEGHKVLVFSQFTRHLDLAERALRAHRQLRLQGSTPAGKRADLVRRFQAGEADVFLISLKAGGTGLNLTAATYVVHLDPWWNPAAEDQATDRAHRIGQEQPVTVYRLVAADTVEDGILEMQAAKRAVVEGLLGGAANGGAPDLEALRALIEG